MLSQLRSSIKRLEADIVAYDAADLAFLLEFRRLDTNLGSSIDLSSAESRKMNAAAKLISSSAEAITYYSKLRIAQGDLVPEMMLEFSNSLLTCTQARDN
jgi:hypothetical protein